MCKLYNLSDYSISTLVQLTIFLGFENTFYSLLYSISDSRGLEYIYAANNKQKHPQASIYLNGQRVKMTIDKGSSINVAGKQTFRQLRDIRPQPTSMKDYLLNSTTPVKMEGKFRVLAESKHKFTVATVYVTSDNGGCLVLKQHKNWDTWVFI